MRRIIGVISIAGAVALTATACGSTSSSSSGAKAPAAANGAAGGSKTVTLYTVDGLSDWYTKEFAAFQQQTGIHVNTVESGSGEVVTRLEKEKNNVQADLAITLPPFIQNAADENLLAAYTPAGSDQVPASAKDPQGKYTAFMNNYLDWIYNPDQANPAPASYKDLLDGRFKGRLQYSTPGQAGDGTAVLIELQHVYGKQGALDYLKKLQSNNVGPSSSTGKLQPQVSKGELSVANGDLQMNLQSIRDDKSNFKVFFPADDNGQKSTFALPYYMGLVNGAPHADAAKKLMDFLLTTDVQNTISSDALGLPVRQDVHPTDANYTELQNALHGVDIWTPDWNQVTQDQSADIDAYNKATGQ